MKCAYCAKELAFVKDENGVEKVDGFHVAVREDMESPKLLRWGATLCAACHEIWKKLTPEDCESLASSIKNLPEQTAYMTLQCIRWHMKEVEERMKA